MLSSGIIEIYKELEREMKSKKYTACLDDIDFTVLETLDVSGAIYVSYLLLSLSFSLSLSLTLSIAVSVILSIFFVPLLAFFFRY